MDVVDKSSLVEDIEDLVERWFTEILVAGEADKDIYDDSHMHWINVYLSAAATLISRVKYNTEKMGGSINWPNKSKGSS